MFVSKVGIELIKVFEGFVPTAYKCAAGCLTIGYGHKLKKGEKFNNITVSEAVTLLEKDLYEICKGINRMTHVQLLQTQYDAIVSFVFNVGLGAYQRSTLRSIINRGDHQLVPKEIMKWVYIGLHKSHGLSRRRKIEAAMYVS